MNFVEELEWRGMIHDIMPGTKEQFEKEMTAAYIGFDPTADSLHIGSLVQIMILVHLQKCGHKPFALVGGATGMVGDPSGKSKERNLLDENTLNHNLACVQKQLEQLLKNGCSSWLRWQTFLKQFETMHRADVKIQFLVISTRTGQRPGESNRATILTRNYTSVHPN